MKNKINGSLLERLSLVPVRLHRKLLIAFSLMSIIPLLIAIYLTSTYVVLIKDNAWSVAIVIATGILIAISGFYLTRSIIDSVIRLSAAAKKIASGHLEQAVNIEREDEIGDLESSLQRMAKKLRDNMDEIQLYGEKIGNINVEISKKVVVLSSLLQVGNVMAASIGLDTILRLVLDKISQTTNTERAFLMLLDKGTNQLVTKFSYNLPGELQKAKVKVNQGFFGKILAGNKPFIIDSSVRGNKEMRSFSDTYKMNNACLSPISAKGTPIGLLIIGNNLKDFVFQKDELEITNIFIRQIAIAVENDWLAKKAADLTLKDEITDLYNEKYINNRLQEEIKRAIMYQRPCSFAILNIDDFKAYKKNNSELAGEAVLKKITVILNKNISDVDKAARLKEDIFALILPETNKGEALKIVEKIRKIVEEFSFSGEKSQPGGRLTVSAGISANPIDGLTAGDLIEVASTALGKAKKEGKNKVAI